MKGWLIVYNNNKDYRLYHYDPDYFEFTYGDNRRLLKINEGDYIFFHTTILDPNKNIKRRVIVSYFKVKNIMSSRLYRQSLNNEIKKAKKFNKTVYSYSNPHIISYFLNNYDPIDDYIVFADPLSSKLYLNNPVPFEYEIVEILSSLNIKLTKENENILLTVSNATRQIRQITEDEAIDLIKILDNNQLSINTPDLLDYDSLIHKKYIESIRNVFYSIYKLPIKFQYEIQDESESNDSQIENIVTLNKTEVQLNEERLMKLNRILKIYKKISLKKLCKFLNFDNIDELEEWILDYAYDLPLRIDNDELISQL